MLMSSHDLTSSLKRDPTSLKELIFRTRRQTIEKPKRLTTTRRTFSTKRTTTYTGVFCRYSLEIMIRRWLTWNRVAASCMLIRSFIRRINSQMKIRRSTIRHHMQAARRTCQMLDCARSTYMSFHSTRWYATLWAKSSHWRLKNLTLCLAPFLRNTQTNSG